MKYTAETLQFRPNSAPDSHGLVTRVVSADAGWELLNMEVRHLNEGQTWHGETGEDEAVFVLLGGACAIEATGLDPVRIGERRDVFSGLPYAVYLPRHSQFTVNALTDAFELAHCWVPTDRDGEPRVVRPEDCPVELRGGHNASRQITHIIPPGFGNHRIVCCEVYTPHGNWSSYPPHKHDEHREALDGSIVEADLEEFYYYKIDKPDGYALQRIYTGDGAIDATMAARDNDIVLVPEGYHPVSAAYGYNCYYLNFLAGTAQSLAATDDPEHAWTKETWSELDARVPMVTLDAMRTDPGNSAPPNTEL